MEIALQAQDHCLALLDTLAHVRPLSCKLDGCLNRLRTRIHRQHHVVSEHGGDLLREDAEDGVVECTRGERELLGLRRQRVDNARVAVALVDRTVWTYRIEQRILDGRQLLALVRPKYSFVDARVCGEHVNVLCAFWVPYSAKIIIRMKSKTKPSGKSNSLRTTRRLKDDWKGVVTNGEKNAESISAEYKTRHLDMKDVPAHPYLSCHSTPWRARRLPCLSTLCFQQRRRRQHSAAHTTRDTHL